MNISVLIEKYLYPSPLHDQVLFDLFEEWKETFDAFQDLESRKVHPGLLDLIDCRLRVLSQLLGNRLRFLDSDYRELSSHWPKECVLFGPVDLDEVPF